MFHRQLTIRHLRFVLTFAACGSMTRTAEKLCVSYPAAAKTRLEIEEAIGTRLITGRGEDAALTDAGLCLLAASERILKDLSFVAEEIAALREGLKGVVRVGVHSLDALRWLAPRITEFRDRFPGVIVSLVDGLHDAVSEGEVDLALGRAGPLRSSSKLALHPLFAIRSVIVASGAYMQDAALTRHAADCAKLLHKAWILAPQGTPLRDRFDEHLAYMGLPKPTEVIIGGDATAQRELMRVGSFLGVSSEEVARGLVKDEIAVILPTDASALNDNISLIWKSNTRLHPAVYRLKRFLLEEQE